jgi:hypothetical protein
MTLRLNGSTSGYTEIDAPAIAGSNTLRLPTGNGVGGNVLTTDGSGNLSWVDGRRMVLETAKTASGPSVDFTDIPSWTKRITVVFDGLSMTPNTVVYPLFQLGDSGGIETTGYSAYSSITGTDTATGVSTAVGTFETGGFFFLWGTAASLRYGTYTFTNITGNQWTGTGLMGGVVPGGLVGTAQGGGTKTLSGTLDRIRITTTNGADTFDAGTINTIYEG